MFEREYRDLSFVPRWGIIRTIRYQSVAEHSYFVALYAQQFAQMIEWKGDYSQLLHAALLHDVEECFISDIPGPVKQHITDKIKYENFVVNELNKRFDTSSWPSLTDEIKVIIKMADELDGIFHIASEIQLGNNSVGDVYAQRVNFLKGYFQDAMINIFGWKPDDVAILWRMQISTALDKNINRQSQVVHGMEIK